MICPHCEYEHGWSEELLNDIRGGYGEFFCISLNGVVAVRHHTSGYEQKNLFFCPKCGKCFIEVNNGN